MKKSAKKQQLHVQTIQITVTSRNVTQDKGKQFLERQFWFYRQCLGPFVVSYNQSPESRTWLLENYICVRAFKYRPVPYYTPIHYNSVLFRSLHYYWPSSIILTTM